MDKTTLRLRTLELLGDVAEGSSTYAPGGDFTLVDSALEQAQQQVAQVLGITYREVVAGVTAASGATGSASRVPPLVALPSDAVSLVRIQIWDSSMTDIVTPGV